MVQVRNIAAHETPPSNVDHVFIERTGNKYTANGSVAHAKSGTFWTPPPFDTVDAAISASVGWAEQNDVTVVYVRAVD